MMEAMTKDTAERYALESMNHGVLLIKRNGEIFFANRTARSIFQIEQDTKCTFRDLFYREDGSNDSLIDLVTESIVDPGKKKDGMIQYQNPEGRRWMLLFSCTALKQDENVYVLTFTDQTELYKSSVQYRDSAVILSLLFAITGLWTVLVAFWEWKGRFVSADKLTTWIEVIGVIMVFVFIKASSLTLSDMGISLSNWKQTLRRTGVRVASLWGLYAAVKLILLQMMPGFFPEGAPFWDWKQADLRLMTYLFTALLQEFLSRGGCQEAIMRILPGKYRDAAAIGLTSLFFMSLHLQRGLPFMLGSGLLSILLGLVYRRDRNIYGVAAIHYCFGKFADFFGFL